MLEKVSEALAEIRAPGRFVTRRTSPPGDLHLEVKGVGAVGLPVSQATARKLCAVARPARYGLKEQTLLDPKVRDTWEIARSRIRIDKRRWNKTLLPQLQRIRRDLGLPDGCSLKAQLHNMLVYEPGQFFSAHQDSEKTDDMVGTLVVVLPSAVKGGALVVVHGGETATCRGSDKALTFFAFYADCRHEVRPVKEGYRVALTYNLLLEGEASPETRATGQEDALARAVRDYFETARPRNWRRPEEAPPDRLVYLLDYEYTQRGLGWNRLKNEDAVRVAALKEAAERLDCGMLLGLAKVHEMWSCEEEDYDRYGWYGRYDEEDEEDEEEPVPIALEDFEIELHHCVGADRGLSQIVADIDGDEVCSTKDSDAFEPYDSEYEGYMGNYGNTLDRWYHRAAVVLWPRERTFALRARASAHWAMGEVAKPLRAGDVEGARRMAEGLVPFWKRGVYAETRRDFPALTLKVAAGLEAPDLSATLLEPFCLEQLTAKAAPHLMALAEAYGIDWCASILEQWESGGGYDSRLAWLTNLPELCRALCADGSAQGLALAGLLVERQCVWAREAWQDICELAHPGHVLEALKEMREPMLGLFESSRIAGRPDLLEGLLGFLSSEPTGSPTEGLVHLLRSAHRSRSGEALRALQLTGLRRHCAEELSNRLAAPARRKDDWSIGVRLQCACQMCQVLSRFLAAPDQVRYEWPLAKAGRAHIHQTIDGHDLPVDHTTRRAGRPYTLVLTKTKALFQREAAERRAWERDVRWLKNTAHAFGNG